MAAKEEAEWKKLEKARMIGMEKSEAERLAAMVEARRKKVAEEKAEAERVAKETRRLARIKRQAPGVYPLQALFQ